MRKKIILVCRVCKSRNYTMDKSATSTKRLEIKKFCKQCNQHTMHQETK